MTVLKYYVEIKHYSTHESRVNENKVLSYYEALKCEIIKNPAYSLTATLVRDWVVRTTWEYQIALTVLYQME